jgi:hypothetical protein
MAAATATRVVEQETEAFEPVYYTCPGNPELKFISRIPGFRRGEESLMTNDYQFVYGGFVARTPEEVATVERMRANPTYSSTPIYREPGPELPFRCRQCAFRTGIVDLFNEHVEKHLDR